MLPLIDCSAKTSAVNEVKSPTSVGIVPSNIVFPIRYIDVKDDKSPIVVGIVPLMSANAYNTNRNIMNVSVEVIECQFPDNQQNRNELILIEQLTSPILCMGVSRGNGSRNTKTYQH